ncbi:MAG: universal stress protein [Desulfovibrio sp.]|jgi:nucleotide-binding universal stress UspA family protein
MIATFRKILVPLDDSEHSRNALRYAMGVAQAQKSHLALLHSIGRIPMLIGGEPRKELVQELVREAEKLLAPHAKKLREIGIEPALIIKEGKPGEVIVQEAKSGNYDLIVMGSRGLSDIEGVILGSNAHRVLSGAHCPVLVTR